MSNPFQACSDIFFKPNRVFATLADTHNWSWVAFIIVVVMGVLPSYLYFNLVDFDWYRELLVQANLGDVSPSEQNQMRNSITKDATLTFSLVAGIIGVIIVNSVLALYLNLVTKSDEENVNGFTDWYGFTWWVGLPVVVNSLLALMLLLFAQDQQISPSYIVPTSLAFILGLDMQNDWFGLCSAIRLDAIWSIYLIAVGICQWTNFSKNKAFMVAALPYSVIWGVWFMLSLGSNG
ncbi:YIP1 family protein [Aestuariibacter sp. AA17]|uniref:YIP1 family protein n=1 Tax=Fluctibacter corallii TaxID=2984329 RepID=A0ABT3AAG1_9ALTE|nr:YIP1 family protein [Aestuariibacter sp. AA17]